MPSSFTINGAYANFLERETGSLQVGKVADIVVIDGNLFEMPASEIGKTRVVLTLFEGREVYRDASLHGE
ncbi:MAG: amidohydrolase family protein [Deltaproteobacteria bacterium]|nr:amidohydrolase family protein [Deltaproteobacteria bacterium]